MGGKEGKRGQWGLGKGTKSGAFDSENGASKGRGSHPTMVIHRLNIQKIPHMRSFFILCVMLHAKRKYTSHLGSKNKLHDEESEHAFILGSMTVHTVANKNECRKTVRED
jgi:hypothetical protein